MSQGVTVALAEKRERDGESWIGDAIGLCRGILHRNNAQRGGRTISAAFLFWTLSAHGRTAGEKEGS